MPRLINNSTGAKEWIHPDNVQAKLESGEYSWPESANVVSAGGAPVTIPGSQTPLAGQVGYREALPEEVAAEQLKKDAEGKPIQSALEGAASTLSLGVTDPLLEAYYGGSTGLRARRETTAGQVGQYGSMVLPFGAPGAIMRGSAALRAMGLGAIEVGMLEGAAFGTGHLISESGLSDDPITAEKIVGTLGTSVLLGGGVGAVAGAFRGAKDAYLGYLKNKIEVPPVGAADDLIARTPKGTDLAGEVLAFRNEYRSQIPALQSLKGAGLSAEARAIGARTARAFGALANKPETLAENPGMALDAMQLHRTYLNKIASESDAIRFSLTKMGRGPVNLSGVVPVTQPPGARWELLDRVPKMLEKNQALTERLRMAKALPGKLKEIEKAEAMAAQEATKRTFADRLVGGLAFSGLTSVLWPLVGHASPFVASALVKSAANGALKNLGNRMLKSATQTDGRVASAVRGFFSAGESLAKQAVVKHAAKAIEGDKPSRVEKARKAYDKRLAAVKSAVGVDLLSGMVVTTPNGRQAIGKALSGVKGISPIVADRMETVAARRLAFLAQEAPKNPGLPGWQASRMDMQRWMRLEDATGDIAGVMERMAQGTLLPEDVKALQAVYPEYYTQIKLALMAAVAEKGGAHKLPYWKRLMLSLFTGRPIDAAMHPNVLAVLQGNYMNEEGTQGGTTPPPTVPNFGEMGSTKKTDTELTSAQSRQSEG